MDDTGVISKIDGLLNDVHALRKRVDEITTQQRILENTTYNGNLLWEIYNISVRITQAEKGKITSFCIVLPHTLIAMDINFALEYT